MAENKKDEKIVFCTGGGCTAKLGAGVLRHILEKLPRGEKDPNLLVGYDSRDDAAVYRITDDIALVQTVDFFPPMVDDPYTFGQIAAANALSDVYAMGGEVKTALNLVCFPESMDLNILGEILRGGAFIALVRCGDRGIAVLCRRDGGVICSLRCPRCSGIRLFRARCERQHDGGAEQKSR